MIYLAILHIKFIVDSYVDDMSSNFFNQIYNIYSNNVWYYRYSFIILM